MEPVVEVGAAALLSRNIIQYLRNKGYLTDGLQVTIANFVISYVLIFILDVVNLLATGTPISLLVFKTAATAVAAAIYNDLNNLTKNIAPPPTVPPTNRLIDPVVSRQPVAMKYSSVLR